VEHVGLAEAARQFDPSRGGQFTTYAYYRIRGAILDGLETILAADIVEDVIEGVVDEG
jgi:DNA-directed RNA polymerase specialized sigma subunit